MGKFVDQPGDIGLQGRDRITNSGRIHKMKKQTTIRLVI
jgi:hypothetical protein